MFVSGNNKVQLELNLSRDVKENKRGFYKYINDRMQNRPMLKETVHLVIYDMEITEILNAFFASVFTRKTVFSNLRTQKSRDKGRKTGRCAFSGKGTG